jgi:hypothetical protein
MRRPERERHDLPPDWAPVPSAEDLEALRAARRRSAAPAGRFAALAAVALFSFPPRRSTSAGWLPFRLPPPGEE